ncbi:hypothetical protein AIOL_003775 [Candidatus Rhodobacter oscarellae]|uniref:Flavin reductase like domain-containing protein n=1 Tax=Candidatus Rhodobacter oscarellae TaxID=1675527 RepID=A0A0J9E7S3_9RHOB|nr:LysR substrate-binding domain-containing protein [Candidatus Rhodobacter lobularis]KMW58795.1 hypothetical protein AIOL_003775 [Candidatus Rhodobacter lobularis]
MTMELRDKFIAGMSHAAATVNVITTDGAAGRAGVTVSAMSSVSADGPKPTLLVCVHHMSPAAEKMIENGVFCVNVLRDDQSYISDSFAGRFKDQLADKFDCAEWEAMTSGAPRVRDPLVAFDCTIQEARRIGTHHVFIGEVEDVYVHGRGSALVYANRGYGATARIEGAESVAAGQRIAQNRLCVACFHTFGPYILPAMMRRMRDEAPELQIDLIEGDQRRVQESLLAGEADVGLLYDIALADGLDKVVLTRLQPYVLLAADHPLAAQEALRPEDLAEEQMILLHAPPSRDYFLGIMREAGVEPRVVYRTSNLEMVRGMVGQGLGYSILATRPAAQVAYDGAALVERPLLAETEPSRVVLATRTGLPPSRAAEQFIWFCRDYFDLHH